MPKIGTLWINIQTMCIFQIRFHTFFLIQNRKESNLFCRGSRRRRRRGIRRRRSFGSFGGVGGGRGRKVARGTGGGKREKRGVDAVGGRGLEVAERED